MSRKYKNVSFSAEEGVLQKARLRARDTERGNLSAYIEKLILKDLHAHPVALRKKEAA